MVQRQILKNATAEQKKKSTHGENGTTQAMKQWWIDKIIRAIFPTGKMTLMLHNHFVATHQKVKVNYGFSAQSNLQACFW
jgi:uncharacterized protein (DUF1800 family)